MLAALQVCLGACLGAMARWLFGLLLNPLFSGFAVGTLVVNLLGSFIMGCLLGLFGLAPRLEAQWQLFLVTGFLGSFTTFSAFAGELCRMLLAGRWAASLGLALLEVTLSVLLVFLGLWLVCSRSLTNFP